MTGSVDIPAAWADSATAIARHRWRTILVVGAMDRGKSTYCHVLSQHLLATGERVAVVDADVGQKDIGPPATITMGYAEPVRPLSALQPAAFYFVGAVSPLGHLLPMVVGTRRLVDAARAPRVIVNTTGLVHGPGLVLKGYKIDALQPDVIVAIEQDGELQPLLRAYRHYRQLCLPPSAQATIKTPEQRRQIRERAFWRYFQGAQGVELGWRQLVFQRHAPPCEQARDLLCGLADQRQRGLGLAIITASDVRRGTIALHTPVPAARIRVVQAGDLYLRADGVELGRR